MPDVTTFFQFHLLIFVLTLTSSFLLTRIILELALRFGWTAKSDNRSSHVGQLAFGGGISVIAVSLGAWILLAQPFSQIQIIVLLCVLVLALVSWMDDLNNLSSKLRMLTHVGVVTLCLVFLPSQQNILPFDWPIFVDRVFAGFFWIWFINLFNFMDGIDALAGVEAFFIGLGIFILGLVGSLGFEWHILALVITGAIGGFLPWNWHKARIMLGDIGAVPLGFLLGFLLIQLALEGYWLASLILPGYFITDATITILRRLLRGKKIWHPHRSHFYQRASSPTKGHDRVVIRVVIANIALVGVAVLSTVQPGGAGLLAILIVAGLLYSLVKLAKTVS